jgi:hypothetical protein
MATTTAPAIERSVTWAGTESSEEYLAVSGTVVAGHD